MVDQVVSRTSIKTAAAARAKSGGRALRWSDVLRAIPRDLVRLRVLERYRAQGFTADDFARLGSARAAMADALTRAQDWLELEHPRWTDDGAAVAAVRRPLELEIP